MRSGWGDIEDVDATPSFSESFGALPRSIFIMSIQQALNQLAKGVGDSSIAVAADSILGPITTAATNKALSKYVIIAPSNLKTGNLSPSEIEARASDIIGALSGEIIRRGIPAPKAPVKTQAPKSGPMVSARAPETKAPEMPGQPWYVKYKKPIMITTGVLLGTGILVVLMKDKPAGMSDSGMSDY